MGEIYKNAFACSHCKLSPAENLSRETAWAYQCYLHSYFKVHRFDDISNTRTSIQPEIELFEGNKQNISCRETRTSTRRVSRIHCDCPLRVKVLHLVQRASVFVCVCVRVILANCSAQTSTYGARVYRDLPGATGLRAVSLLIKLCNIAYTDLPRSSFPTPLPGHQSMFLTRCVNVRA